MSLVIPPRHRPVRLALVIAVAAAIVGTLLCARHIARSAECRDGPSRRLDAWNSALRSSVQRALGDVPWRAKVIDGLETASSTWEHGYRAVCEAGGPRRNVRMRCLDHALDGIRELATSLAGATDDRTILATRVAAPAAVAALPPASACEVTEVAAPNPPVQDPHVGLEVAVLALERGDVTTAETTLGAARGRALGIYGEHHPELASYDDVLGDIERVHGKLRAALALHDQSEQLRTAAFGAEDPSIATSLYHRALTLLEGGELGNAERALHRALALRAKTQGESSPALGELYAALSACDAARGDRDGAREHAAKAVRLDALIGPSGGPPAEARAGAAAQTPAALVALATSRFAAGDHVESADVFATALAQLSNEPNRTALAASLGLAHCDDSRAGQAARTAVQLYLAMPELDRAAMPAAQELAKKP